MFMLGSLVNAGAVILAALIGTALKKGIPERVGKTVISAVGIAVIFIGITGALSGYRDFTGGESALFSDYGMLFVILSLAIGALIGELIDIDKWVGRLGEFAERRLTPGERREGTPPLAVGFVNCTILFCVGSMAILGGIQDTGREIPTILFSKTILDAISALLMSATMGIGCALSAIPLLLYQGFFSLLSLLFLSSLPTEVMGALGCVGSLIIAAIGSNMLGVTKIKTANFIPAIFLPLLLLLAV